MKTSTTLLTQTITELRTLDESYEIIENEQVLNRDFNNLTLAGALFSLSTFDRSNFLSCVFYGTRIENSVFRNCTFENCTFEFSHFYAATFISCTFKGCTWKYSTINKTKAHCSEMDHPTSSLIHQQENNQMIDCFTANPELTQNSLSIVELYDTWFAAKFEKRSG